MSTSTQGQPSASTRNAKAKADDKVSTAETIARFIAEGVSGSGVKGLEGPAKTLLGIIVHYKRARDNSALCRDVAAQISALTETLKAANDTVRAHIAAEALPTTLVQAQLGSSAELSNRIEQLQRRLAEINSNASKLQNQKTIKRTVLANRNSDILKEMCDHLRQAREDFMLAGQLAVEIVLAEVAAEVKANSLAAALDKLPSAEASYRASVHARHGHLLSGTREALLKELDDWAAAETDSQGERPFYILSGGAGTGKSTIAYELASRADKVGRLGASFFFMRGSALLNTTEVFFPTLARQLIRNVPALQENALALIQGHLKHGARQNLDRQAKDLFASLLSPLPSDHPPVIIVVDAVDECTDSAQDLVCRMLYLMMDALSHISSPVRIFVTSRPEVHIEDTFRAKAFSSAPRFRLHEIPRTVIDADSRLYFNRALAELPDGPRKSLFLLYPDASDDLTDLAAGLFIYATTAVEFLKQYRSAITQGMERLVLIARGEPKTALQRLDELYILVLQSAFPRDFLQNERDTIRAFLGHVAVLQDHISPSDLATLIGVKAEKDIQPVLERLGAVLSFELGNPRAPMRPLHASFGEFLVDATRCTDPNFHVNLAERHLAVASSCLGLLMRPGVLVYNVCRLPDTSVPRDEIEDLGARVAKYMPAPVQYSCKHWFVHLAHSGADHGITPRVLDFCRQRLMEWVEAIVFLDSVDRLLLWLPNLHRLYSAPGGSQEARQLLFEIWRFVLEFSPAIKTCPQQIYLSALPLLPSSSKLLETINTRQDGSPAFSCSHGIVPEWPVWCDVQPSAVHGSGAIDIQCAVLDPSGRWIAVAGSDDGAIHLCHLETGNIFLTVRAHDNEPVEHLCVSSNGLRLVSTSDGRVCVISTRSGAVLNQFDVPVVTDGYSMTGNFIMNDSAVLIRYVVDDESDKLLIWDLETDTVTDLPIPEDPGNIMKLHNVASTSTGLWAIALAPSIGPAPERYLGYVFDLASGSVAYTLPLSGGTACFGSSDIAVVQHAGALCLFDIAAQRVLRTLEGRNTNHWSIAASPGATTMTVIGVRLPCDNASQHIIDVWDAAGRRICVPTGRVIQCAFLRPSGRGLLIVTDSSWRMIDVDRASSLSASVALGDMDDDTYDDSPETETRGVATAISHDCSLLAFALKGTMHILDAGGITITTIALSRDPLNPLFVRLAFSHERRLVAAMTVRVICLYNTADGIMLGRYEIPDDAIRELSDDARLRRSGLGSVDCDQGEGEGDESGGDADESDCDEGDITFEFEHVAFTPDDTAIVVIMAERHRYGLVTRRVALYTALWSIGCPGPCRISVLSQKEHSDYLPGYGTIWHDLPICQTRAYLPRECPIWSG